MRFKVGACLRVDDRPDVGFQQLRDRRPAAYPCNRAAARWCDRRSPPAAAARAPPSSAGRRCRTPIRQRRSTTCSGNAELSTNITFWPPVSAISAASAASRAASCRLMSCATSVEPVNATPATRGSASSARPSVAPSPGSSDSTSRGTPASCSSCHRARGDQRRLLGGLGEHGVARGQRRGHLAGEDGQRKIPRADAHEHTAAVHGAARCARRSGRACCSGVAKSRFGARRVVAQEVHRLAHFGERIRPCLAGFAHAQTHQLHALRLEGIGGAAQAAARGRLPALPPSRRSARGGGQRRCASAARASITVPTTSSSRAGFSTGRAAPVPTCPPTTGAAR